MKEPIFQAKPGDPIRADIWNQLQSRLRQEIYDQVTGHIHSGDDQGRRLTGNAIDPTSVLAAKELAASDKLSVSGLNVAETLAQINTKLAQLGTSLDTKIGQVNASITTQIGQLNSQLTSQFNTQIGQLSSQLTSQFNTQLGQLSSQLTAQISTQSDQLNTSITTQVGQLNSQLTTQFNSQLNTQVAQLNTQLGQRLPLGGGTLAGALTVNSGMFTANAGATINGGPLICGDVIDVRAPQFMNNNALYFRNRPDYQHGVGWFSNFANQNVDGPTLFGNGGGVLGTSNAGGQKAALRWDLNQTVNARGLLQVDGPFNAMNGSNLFNGVCVQDGNILFRKTGDQNHGLGWFSNAGGKQFFGSPAYAFDGPILWGYNGGALATATSGVPKLALTWDNNNNVRVGGTLYADGPVRFQNQAFRATQVFNQSPGDFPKSTGFTTNGGTLLIFASGTVWANPSNGVIGFFIIVDGVNRGPVQICANELGSHKACSSNAIVVTGLAAGNHTMVLDRMNANTRSDTNDYQSVTVLEIPNAVF